MKTSSIELFCEHKRPTSLTWCTYIFSILYRTSNLQVIFFLARVLTAWCEVINELPDLNSYADVAERPLRKTRRSSNPGSGRYEGSDHKLGRLVQGATQWCQPITPSLARAPSRRFVRLRQAQLIQPTIETI